MRKGLLHLNATALFISNDEKDKLWFVGINFTHATDKTAANSAHCNGIYRFRH